MLATIATYNLLMDGVDCFEQIGSTYATIRKEKKFTNSMLRTLLEAFVLHVHTLIHVRSRARGSIIDTATVKCKIIKQFVSVYVDYM